jgi:hypothetical protein
MRESLKRWIDGWRTLTIPQAESLTGIWGVLIAMSILHHDPKRRLKSLRKRDVLRWAQKNRFNFTRSMRTDK